MIPEAAKSLSQVMVHGVAFVSSSTSLLMRVDPRFIDSFDNSIRDELQRWSHGFFLWVLVSAFLVAVGVALEGPEILHEMSPRLFTCFTRGSVSRIRKFKKAIRIAGLVGWLLVVVGVAGEEIFEGLQNRAEGQLQTFNDILLREARLNAGIAKQSAIDAADASARAREQSDGATASSANAMALAQGARKEADSFERDIISANQQAADAESHLADALKQAAVATAELQRLKSPRSLTNVPKLITTLEAFKGTEYTLNVFQDDESIQFTRTVDGVLRAAGWIRKQPTTIALGIPNLNIFSTDPKDMVPICIETGISIHVRSKESLEVLQSRAIQDLPKTIQAALTLKSGFAPSISPPDERNVANGILDPEPGEGIPMRICIGKKP